MRGTRTHPARARLITIATMAVVGITAWWAFRPLPAPEWPEAAAAAGSAPAPVQLAALDIRAFSAPLWVAPPAPPAAPAPPPPPPPLPPFKLQLIAVVQEPASTSTGQMQTMAALMYDPDTDKLITLKAGEEVSGRTIIAITSKGVELRERTTTRTLALREEVAPTPGLLRDATPAPTSAPADGGGK